MYEQRTILIGNHKVRVHEQHGQYSLWASVSGAERESHIASLDFRPESQLVEVIFNAWMNR